MRPRRRRALWATGALLAAGVAAGLAVRAQLPPIYSLADYSPPQAAQVFAEGGERIGLIGPERRTVVPFTALPPHLVQAFLAAEDAGFYQHEGIDWLGVLRAVVKNMRPGAHLQGASTITQQTVKTLILGPERSMWRKLREALLARRLEQMLPKDEILAIYLNQIYFGSGAWGVEQAARSYFGCAAADVDLGQAALLAAIPKNPSRYTLRGDRVATKARQAYVLEQMVAHGWATPERARTAIQAALPEPPPPPAHERAAAGYVEHVRRLLLPALGDTWINTGGLRIYTQMQVERQHAAVQALQQSLEEVARRHGWAGAPARLEADVLAPTLTRLRARAEARRQARPEPSAAWAWDLSELVPVTRREPAALERMAIVPLQPLQRLRAPVVALPPGDAPAVLDLGSVEGRLPLAQMAWARPYGPQGPTPAPRRPADALHIGDLIDVEVVRVGAAGEPPLVALVPQVRVEGALVALEPPFAAVRALVGGRDPSATGFNRATQARRQPGSAFKPVLYGAALQALLLTPASICADSPVVIPDPFTGRAWKPENYEDGRYDGNILYRTALARSKNTCSVRLLQKLGIGAAIDMAAHMGIDGPMPNNYTLALGTGEATPMQMGEAMATIAQGGVHMAPQVVQRVVDPNGATVWRAEEPLGATAMTPAAAYVLTSMMRSVVEAGTAQRARALGRPLAAKTGTSQASRDAWAVGFSPTLAAAAWVGLDDDGSMGRETGASAALPAWTRFMGAALAGQPAQDFLLPEGVVTARIDPRTGAASDAADSVVEVFVAGTEPVAQQQALPSIYLEDD